MTEAQLKAYFRLGIKTVPGGPPVGTPGQNRAAGVLAALDKLAEELKAGGNGLGLGYTALELAADRHLYPDEVLVDIQAALDAGTLVWIYDDGSGLRTTIKLADHGVKNDATLGDDHKLTGARTDNTAALFAVRDEYATLPFREQKEITQVFPAGGVVAYQNNRFPLGLNNVVYDLNGTTLVTDYDGTDNQLGRGAFTGEGPQLDVAGYKGTKGYMLSVRFNTARKGSTQLTVQNKADLVAENGWFVEATFLPFSHETIFRGFPVGSTRFEDGSTRITGIDTANGTITFFPPLSQDYLATGPDFLGGSVGERSGAARAQPLDHPGHPMPDYVEFTNGTIVKARNTPEAFAISAKKVRVSKLRFIGNLTPTESPAGFEAEDVRVEGEVELDKLVGPTTFKEVAADGFVSNGGGIKSLEWVGGKSGTSLQVSPPTARIVGVHCHAKPFSLYDVTTNTTIEKAADPALADYGHVEQRFVIENLQLSAAPASEATAYIGKGSYREVYVNQVDNGRIKAYHNGTDKSEALPYLKNLTVGTPIHTINGEAGGRVSKVEFVPDNETLVTGQVYTSIEGFTPEAQTVLTFTPVLNLIDNGGHTVLTPEHPARLYGYDTLRWKGNQGTSLNVPGPFTITNSDLLLDQYGAAYYRLCGFVDKVELRMSAASAAGRLKISLLDKGNVNGADLCQFALTSGATRSFSATTNVGMSAIVMGDPDLNQYRTDRVGTRFGHVLNLFLGNVALANVPPFELTITPRYY